MCINIYILPMHDVAIIQSHNKIIIRQLSSVYTHTLSSKYFSRFAFVDMFTLFWADMVTAAIQEGMH